MHVCQCEFLNFPARVEYVDVFLYSGPRKYDNLPMISWLW